MGEAKKWYINDHTFVRADDGQWHLFGITHEEPANGMQEKFFAHANAPDLLGPWTKQAPVLQADPAAGEIIVWAPYVFKSDGKYWIYYCGGGKGHDTYEIHLATSTDLVTWDRSPDNPMLVDGWDARDPMVLKVDDGWMLYYCATSTPQGGNHTVKAVKSKDLTHWTDPTEVFSTPKVGRSGGPTGIAVRRGAQWKILSFCLHQHWLRADRGLCQRLAAPLGLRGPGGSLSRPRLGGYPDAGG